MTEPGGISRYPPIMTVSLTNNLYLFSNVKITRDYSTTHDMTPQEWFEYLINENDIQSGDMSPPVIVYQGEVNYYRLPEVIRIEANYDEIRKATYGCLDFHEMVGPSIDTSFTHLFFWVDSVRLVKQCARIEASPGAVMKDVVELTIASDLWSNKFTDCKLYDTFIVRRHEQRWSRDHTDPDDPNAWVYHPKYYPNAADDVGGAYEPEGDPQDLTEPLDISGEVPGWTAEIDLRFIVISVLDADGKLNILIGASAVMSGGSSEVPIYTDYANGKKLFTLNNLMSGDVFTAAGISASHVQSITVTPYIEAIKGAIHGAIAGGVAYLYLRDIYIPFAANFELHHGTGDLSTLGYISAKTEVNSLGSGLYSFHQHDVDPKLPEWVFDAQNPLRITYADKNEPMLYRSPARIRRVTSGMGGTIVEVPDIDAFRHTYTCQNLFELDQAIVVVFGGGLIEKANALGNIGTIVGASLPIFSSAWKEYQAIQKAGDDIAYNAQQVSTIVGTVTGAGAGAIGGAIAGAAGGPAGAVGGAVGGSVGGIVQGVTRYWTNSENLRAKRETIKNSPCTVKSGGSGLAAYIKDYIDIHYQPLKLDDVSMNKLRTQYYYFGYNVNMVIPGTISTHVRKYFDYIETSGARIRGDVNAEEASAIAGIFDRGVRIYHGADGYKQIGNGMGLENPETAFLE